MTLDRVEDLLSGFKQMLSYLVEDLVHNQRDMEAFGIMTRNGLQSYVRQDTLTKLEKVVYDPTKDTSVA